MKNIYFYLLILVVNNSFSQSFLKKNIDGYENIILGEIIDTKTIKGDCILEKVATVSITKIISGNRFENSKEIKIPYSELSMNCMSGSFSGISYYKKETYFFFFNNEDTVTEENHSRFEIRTKNSSKYESLINDYKTIAQSDSTEIIDWIIKYANQLNFRNDAYRELFQSRGKLGKYYIPLNAWDGNCDCKSSYSLNKNQKKNLRNIYLKNNEYTTYDSCILQVLSSTKDDKEVYFSAIKKLNNCYSKKNCGCEKSIINEITKLCDDKEIINFSEKMMTINTYENKFDRYFKKLIKKLSKNTTPNKS